MTDILDDVDEFDEAAEDLAIRIDLAGYFSRTWTAWGFALLSGAVAAGAAFQFAHHAVLMVALLGVGLGVLGYIDAKTKIILNKHTGSFGVLVLGMLIGYQIDAPGQPVIWVALATAVGIFLAMLVLWRVTGFASGGDIKLAPVVASGLSVVSPLAAALWLMFAFVLCLVVTIVRAVRAHGGARKSVPMGPLMAAALPLSVVATVAMYSASGLPFPTF